jgi:hypothetical protein
MVLVIEGRGTVAVTEPGRDRSTYYEDAEIQIFDGMVHFRAYNKWNTCSLALCIIGWTGDPAIKQMNI